MAGGHHDDEQALMQMRPAQQIQQDQQEQQNQQAQPVQQFQDYYVQPYTPLHQQAQRNEHMKNYNLHSVRQAVEAVMPDAYHQIDLRRSQEAQSMRLSVLHHSRGRTLAANGAVPVLEFDLAGSGFKQFRSDYIGLKGKGDSITDYMLPELQGAAYIFQWVPGVQLYQRHKARLRAEENLRKIANGTLQLEDLSERERHNALLMQRWNKRFGQSQQVCINDTMISRTHIRMTEDEQKKRITMAGPLWLSGISNRGDYSIENLREYMLSMGKDYLTPFLRNWTQGASPHNVWLRIRGHSRGAVASIEGAMMIKYWLRQSYPDFEEYVKFDVTQFDPVPGAGSYDDHASVDLMYDNRWQVEHKMVSLHDAETTVVYSMHSDHALFFTPQKVKNTKRIILTPFTHAVGLNMSDEQQSTRGLSKHRLTLTDAQTGDAYRIGSLNELHEGVYVVDEQNNLVRLQDEQQWTAICQNVLRDASLQQGRHQVLDEMVHAWFASHQAAPAQQG